MDLIPRTQLVSPPKRGFGYASAGEWSMFKCFSEQVRDAARDFSDQCENVQCGSYS